MSIVGITDMLVERSVFSNTGQGAGTPPMAGIDIEPDDTSDATVNLTLRDCVSRNNIGGGYDISLKRNNASTYLAPKPPLSILFDNCSVEGSGDFQPAAPGKYTTNIDGSRGGYNINGIATGTRGQITIRNALVQDTPRPGIFLSDIAPAGAHVLFESVELRHVATNLSVLAPKSGVPRHVIASAPITILRECRLGLPYCYVIAQCCAASFANVTVVDEKKRPFMWVDAAGGPPGTEVHQSITGNVTVTNKYGCQVGGAGTTSLNITCKKAQ
jgi:hypothetical protein